MLMNPGPANSTFSTNGTGASASTSACATSRGGRPARFASASATFVAKSPCSFCARRLQLRVGKLAVEPESGGRRAQPVGEPGLEFGLDHAPPSSRVRTVAIELDRVEGLLHVDRVARVERASSRPRAREEHDGHVGRRGHRAQPGEDLPPVHPGQHQIEDRDVGPGCGGGGDRVLAVRGRIHVEPLHSEVDLQQSKDRWIVVDEQHARHGLSIRAAVSLRGIQAGC